MRILFLGNGRRGARCLEAILRAGSEVAAVVVPHGRREPSARDDLVAVARAADLPILDPRDPNDPSFLRKAADLGADLSVMAGYATILEPEILAIPPLGTINLHGGRLPEYRGGSPVNWQIINGEEVGGCSILYADEGIDTGDILATELYEIGPDTTAGEATARTLEIFPPLLIEVLERIERGETTGTSQDPAAGRYWCKRRPWDGEIDWERMTDREVHNLVRGLNGPDLPGAFSYLREERVGIHRTRVLEETICGPPGRVALKIRGGVAVVARNRALLVTEVSCSKGILQAGEFFRIRGDTLLRRNQAPDRSGTSQGQL